MFKNKVVIVTGASSGIGQATAISFSKEGANTVIVGRNEERLRKVAEECAKQGPESLVVKADISEENETSKIIESTISRFGKIDVLVNNAAVMKTGDIRDGKLLESFDAVIATNLRPVLHLTTLATPHLAKTTGNVVNVSSISALKVVPKLLSYCISKTGLDVFSKGAAQELGPLGIRVNSVNPGPVRTNMLQDMPASDITKWDDYAPRTVLHRVSEPTEVADLILFLASDKAKSITGSIYLCDNGMFIKSD